MITDLAKWYQNPGAARIPPVTEEVPALRNLEAPGFFDREVPNLRVGGGALDPCQTIYKLK